MVQKKEKFQKGLNFIKIMTAVHVLIPSPAPHTSVSPSADSRRAVVSYWPKYVHKVLVNRLGLNLPKKSVVRLTDHTHMTKDVYRGCKTTTQQLYIIAKHSAKYQVSLIITVERGVGTESMSAWAGSPSKIVNILNHMHIFKS